SWERIDQWIRKWVRDYSVERLVVLDDVVNLDRERFDSLLAIVEEMNILVEFPNGLRADLIKEKHVRRLKPLTSGLKVSLESASSRVQHEVLGKNLDPAAVEKVAGWCKRHEVPLQIHYLIGIPGERKEEINDTLKMARRLFESYRARPLLQFATPLSGSKLHTLCEEKRLLTEVPEDIHACFQERSIIKTSEFDPEFLKMVADNFTKAVTRTRQRKVIANLTYRCNNHCVFCAVGDRPKEDANINMVLSALRRYRQEGFELLDIDGGEPTLHEKLFTLIEESRKLGYSKISLITNGRRSSYRAYARRLVDSGIDEVLISLHAGEPKQHELLTGARGSYQQTVGGIENLLKFIENPERVAINTTLVKDNIADCERLGKMLEQMGIRRWNLQVVTPFGRAKVAQVPEEDELKLRLTALLTKFSGKMDIQIVNCPPCLIPGFEEKAALDFNKAARDMIFVGQGGENLQGFLSQRRKQDKRCSRCAYMILCPGFYVF
ncbi:MAG: radical SAM protein, partial [Deltaproteobacteria bacterium]|nr:radical SAM protein [Deltaproteobacteria bacterium]